MTLRRGQVLRTFASDNNAPVASDIFAALVEANQGDAVGYGDDAWTERAEAAFRTVFGEETGVYFTFNGTGANVVGLSSVLHPYEAVIAPASSHLQTDECGALERFAGSKIVAVATDDGKLRAADIEPLLHGLRDEHHVVPRIVSISQATEFGGVYELSEIRELARFAHERGLLLHVDGARLANACVALGCGLREGTRDCGADVLSFGGTKNGLMYGEAILFFDRALHERAGRFVRKQAMQLASKMRYIAVQFETLLQENRWRQYASHANEMARRLESRVAAIDAIRITRPVRCNAVFAQLDRERMRRAQERYFFYVFDEALPEARWMTHHATRAEDVDAFAAALATLE